MPWVVVMPLGDVAQGSDARVQHGEKYRLIKRWNVTWPLNADKIPLFLDIFKMYCVQFLSLANDSEGRPGLDHQSAFFSPVPRGHECLRWEWATFLMPGSTGMWKRRGGRRGRGKR